jgi:long-chain fatty acid transport protein
MLGLWVGMVFSAGAVGVRIPNQDPFAIARGNAFVATADDPGAIYYNPAGITQLDGQHLQVGALMYLGIYADYESPTGQRVENHPEVVPVPSVQYTLTPTDFPLSFGLGVYAPFGLSMSWPDDAPFKTGGFNAKLTYLTLNPVVAWKILPSLSISAGPTFNYSELKLDQAIPGVPLPISQFQFEGQGWGFGFNAGVLWQPHPQWSFGLSYRSSSRTEYEGSASTLPSPPLPHGVGTSSKFDFPQIIIGGVSFRPTPKWNLEVDVDWADWSSVDQLSIQGFPKQPLDWSASFMYEFGVTRYLPKGYYLSAGYFFAQASTTETFYVPTVPDTDLHVGSLGGGHKGEHWDWALAFQLIGGTWRNIDNAANPTVNGRYRLLTPTLSFSIGYHF